MLDIHCHLLHGMDDGPGSLDESLSMCRIAANDGITHAIVTPHIHPGRWDNAVAAIRCARDSLQQQLQLAGIPLQLGFAAEVRLTDQLIQQVAREEIPFLGRVDGLDVVLLEFPHSHLIPGSDKLAEWLLRRDIRPLIAHPERNRQVMRDPSLLRPFIEMGCWLQVTGGSLVGRFGEAARGVAHALLREDCVAIVASDGHNTGPRQPVLSEAFRAVAADYGWQRAERLMVVTPRLVSGRQFDHAVLPA